MASNAPSKAGDGKGGGLGDILSMALLQTGVETVPTTQISLDSNSILNAAANTLDSSLLSTDIGVLTEGLFSTLALVKENPAIENKPCAVNKCSASTSHDDMKTVSVSVSTSDSTQQQRVTALASTATNNENLIVGAGELPTLPHAFPLVEPPSETEVKTAQLLKSELHNSCLDDDIDLDELLSGAGDGMNVDVPLLEAAVGPSSTLEAVSAAPCHSPDQTVGTDTGNSNTAVDDLSSLLNMAGSQHLENLPVSRAPSAGDTTTQSVSTCTLSVGVHAETATVPASSSSSPSTQATTNTSTSTPLLTVTSITTSTSPAAASTNPTQITKSTATTADKGTSTVAQQPTKMFLTKLDLAAILREVTKMSPASKAASTSSLTNTVSVTVVPSAAVQNALRGGGGGVKAQRVVSLSEGVPLVARAPLTLQRYMLHDCALYMYRPIHVLLLYVSEDVCVRAGLHLETSYGGVWRQNFKF